MDENCTQTATSVSYRYTNTNRPIHQESLLIASVHSPSTFIPIELESRSLYLPEYYRNVAQDHQLERKPIMNPHPRTTR
jgi:hypothetical protein